MKILIQGVTLNGQAFRPSDWAERLCGSLSTFGADERLRYATDVRPAYINGARCVVLDRKLEKNNPQAYKFLMDFARENALRVLGTADERAAQTEKRVA